MGILTRIMDGFRASANKALDNMEDVEAQIDQAILDKRAALNKAKSSSADVFGNVHRLEKEVAEAKIRITEWNNRVNKCLDNNNEVKAQEAIIELNKVTENCKSLETSHKAAIVMADNLKKSLNDLEKNIKDLENKRDGLVARYNVAQATEQANALVANIQTEGNTIDLDRLERKIEKKENRAEGLADLKTTSLEDEIDALNNSSSVADQLAEFKAKRNKVQE